MRRSVYFTVILAIAAAVALAAGPVLAQSQQSEGQAQKSEGQATSDDYGQKVHDQFSRGTANFVTGPMAGFKEGFDEAKEGDKNPAWPVTGAVKGTAAGVGRMGVGAFEAVTAPVPQKEPIIKPETFDPEDKVNQGKE